MDEDAARRVRSLASQLAATPHPTACAGQSAARPLPNVRPGDESEDIDPVETSFFVSGAFSPRANEVSTNVSLAQSTLEGKVPSELRGTFLRIGPNPHFDFSNKPYHPFDGDGMIHSFTLHGDGQARYQNKWVRTIAFEKDEEQGFSFSIIGEASQMGQTGNTAWMKYALSSNFSDIGRANTALVWHNDRLLALFEQDQPYEIDLPTLGTIQRVEAFGPDVLKYPTFTAHPKVCPVTQDLVFFGYINGPRKGPWLHYGVVNRAGELVRSFPVNIPAPVMMHDIAITENFSLFYDYNNKFYAPSQIMKGEAETMYAHDTSLKARFGVLPRMATSQDAIIWIECFTTSAVFHFANAWEEPDGEHIRVYGCASPTVDLDELDGEKPSGGFMHLWRLNIKTGKCVEERDLAELYVDFPQVPTDCIGRPSRYAYATHFCAGFEIDGVVKFDLFAETWVMHKFNQTMDGSEPKFKVFGGENMFARRGSASDDDGWLVCFTYGDIRCPSSFDVIDARSMQRVARVAMPAMIPNGFHGLWIADRT